MKAEFGTLFAALLVLGLPCQAMGATAIVCSDADRAIIFSYSSDANAVQPILNVEMQLTDDFGLSTDPSHPNHSGEYIAHGFIVEDMQGADLLWQNADGNELRVMSFRIGKVYEARQALIGGVVAVAGGGLWTVTCQAVEDEK